MRGKTTDSVTTIDEQITVDPASVNTTTDSAKSGFAAKASKWFKIIAYGLGSTPLPLTSNIIGFYLVLYLLETCETSPGFAAGVSLLARVWDAITDPTIGYFVNKTKTRIGQMRPWLFVGGPLVAVSFILFFYSIGDVPGKEVYYSLMIALYALSITTYHIPYTSMIMKITNDRKERDIMTTMRMFNEVLSLVIGTLSFSMIVGQSKRKSCTSEKVDESVLIEERNLYLYASLGISSYMLLICTPCLLFVKELDNSEQKAEYTNFFIKAKRVLKFRPYVYLMTGFLFCSFSVQMVQVNLTLYITYALNSRKRLQYALISVLLTSVATVPVAHWVLLHIGKKKTYLIGMSILLPVFVASIFLPTEPPDWLFYTAFIIAGVGIGGIYLLPWSMLPDCVSQYKKVTGNSDTAVFYSFYVFFNKMAVGLGSAATSGALIFVNYDPRDCEADEDVGNIFRYLIGPSSTVTMIIAMVLIILYPISELDNLDPKHLEEESVPFDSFDWKKIITVRLSQLRDRLSVNQN